jgi:hypothetical protein
VPGLVTIKLIKSHKGERRGFQPSIKEANNVLQKSRDIRREQAIYKHEAYLHLEEVRMAVANQMDN